MRVGELLDTHGRMQGDRGYNNPTMRVGDTLVAVNDTYVYVLPIDGVSCSQLSFYFVKKCKSALITIYACQDVD